MNEETTTTQEPIDVPVHRIAPAPTFRTSEKIDKIAPLMAKVYSEMPQPKMDKENPHFGSKYASPAAIDDAVRQVCGKHGLFNIQTIRDDRVLDCWVVTTRTMDASGQWMETDTPYIMPPGGMGAGPQKHGSSQTYARRYGMAMHFCLAADADDDGNAASEGASASAPARRQQRQKPKQEATGGAKEVKRIEAKFPSNCAICKAKIRKSTPEDRVEIAYAPESKKAAHWECWALWLKKKGKPVPEEPAPPEAEAQTEPTEDYDQRDEQEQAEETGREPTQEEQFQGILSNKADDIADAIALIEDEAALAKLRDMEKAGSNRKTVVQAIDKRQAAVSDDLPF